MEGSDEGELEKRLNGGQTEDSARVDAHLLDPPLRPRIRVLRDERT